MSEHTEQHVMSTGTYFRVFATLMVLTGLTVAVAFFDLGMFNTAAALGIAIFKAVVVILFFMHVYYSSRLTWIASVTGFGFLVIMLAFTIADVVTRAHVTPPVP